jgi:hypothetical protein
MTTPPQATIQAQLKPFGEPSIASEFAIEAQVTPLGKQILIEYRCHGNLFPHLRIPSRSERPQRLDRLWEHTCFEAFLARKSSDSTLLLEEYWELNISPSRDWNLYHFDAYRQGQRPEEAVESIQTEVIHFYQSSSSQEPSRLLNSRGLQLNLALDTSALTLPVIEQKEQKEQKTRESVHATFVWVLGLTAVLENQDGTKSYWALAHHGGKPDFHLRSSFELTLNASES